MIRADYSKWAERQRKQSMGKCPDEIGDRWAGFICLFAMMLWLFDLACWGAP